MGTLWETLREFASTLSTLARAQSVLVLIISSWVFTGVWVFATERKRHDPPRRGRALLGLFWFPGLFLYYAFPGEATAHESKASTFTYEHTPKTVEAPRGWRRSRDEEVTSDGLGPTPPGARGNRRRYVSRVGTPAPFAAEAGEQNNRLLAGGVEWVTEG
jgi:hypothetical protein